MSPVQCAEVEDFVDFLTTKTRKYMLYEVLV
jgi:hypothetical protein